MMRVLVVSYLFSTSAQLNRGVFVLNRIRAVGRCYDVKDINSGASVVLTQFRSSA